MDHRFISIAASLLLIVFSSCQQSIKEKLPETALPEKFDEQQAVVSLLGKELTPPDLPEAEAATGDSLLRMAKTYFDQEPANEENVIRYGQRLAYFHKFYAAINVYSTGLSFFPESIQLLRRRGYQFIVVRKFDLAVADLAKAAKLAENSSFPAGADGLPNRIDRPLGNNHFNIQYHLGVAYYLQGDYQKAKHSYETCLRYANSDDWVIATVNWLYMTYQYLKEREKANQLLKIVYQDMQIVENDTYYKRLMVYKGLLSADSLTTWFGSAGEDIKQATAAEGYGLGHWYLMNGDKSMAMEVFRQVIDGEAWSSFDFMAAEAVLAAEAAD
ncbi:tetratricopeptide repeat protein [Fulvivirgaceae bacterium BMA12]|uniref:Tetratricopeptide repeat protein n=1 Tax=Agaribacillus aureus TaxID=3051825 RepID=A0ABT8L5H5_9BACT|nr:tetratricopeptide repeat protein [Fulvivirgaceae bacterium BMA12]